MQPSILEQSPLNAVGLVDIIQLFSTPRFTRTVGEEVCIKAILEPIQGMQRDSLGNYWILQGDTETIFSCHTDTVHKRSATEQYPLDITDGWLTARDGGVLGADCGTGWLIMLCMLRAGVPGLYVWHRDEEVGGAGSAHFANTLEQFPEHTFKRCIAFDRAGYSDVITHQGGERCCSDAFAEALASELNARMPMEVSGKSPWGDFQPDGTGVFTDSANYTHVVPECTNLSVGYFNQHTTQEKQDLMFLADFIDACLVMPWETLPTERDPNVSEYLNWYDSYGMTDDYLEIEHAAMSDLIATYPDSIADFMQDCGFSIDDLRKELGV